ncbi:hypothetical protein [Nonomuraea sp. bgisy101]|uniref:hypothetical protein n=1 Tax=Nonomuraea sp. bgisy101 TaxID=3413784 RepID=UPI003D72A2E0
MTDPQIAGMALAAAILVVLIAGALNAITKRLLAQRGPSNAELAARLAHPSGRLAALDSLEHIVVLPPGHLETWSDGIDAYDVHLGNLVDELWPREEYLAMVECPRPELTGYSTPAELLEHEPFAEQVECRCGRLHALATRRTRRRAARTGGRRG